VQRYPAYDPPEYVGWKPDPEIQRAFRERINADPERAAILQRLGPEDHLRLYAGLLRNRLHEIMLQRWVRQGVISKAWLGTGEEATTIGACHALQSGDVVAPMIRNAGAGHERGMDVAAIFSSYLGSADSPSRGVDVHFGDFSRGVVPPISMIGSMVPVAAGYALAFKTRGESRVALTWCGDGGVRTGEFHEGLGLAAALSLPLIVVLQDNGIALGTPYAQHSRAPLSEVPRAYGAASWSCDGNHVLDVYAATALAAEHCRQGGGPACLVAQTFRMGGHATHDQPEGRKLLPPEAFAYWGRRDPIGCYEVFLIEEGLDPEPIEKSIRSEIESAADQALARRR
jgi:TPP-dependent pyruvate/acetoin dehydrogenase alpha subunit